VLGLGKWHGALEERPIPLTLCRSLFGNQPKNLWRCGTLVLRSSFLRETGTVWSSAACRCAAGYEIAENSRLRMRAPPHCPFPITWSKGTQLSFAVVLRAVNPDIVVRFHSLSGRRRIF